MPPAPEQDKVKELFPAVEIVTASLPEVVLVPDQEPEAEQEVALVDDQVIVEVLVKRTFKGSAAIETRGAGVTGVVSPPPPPPPQETMKIKINDGYNFVIIKKLY